MFQSTIKLARGGSVSRLFSTSQAVQSHIGSAPVFLSPEVQIEINDLLIPKIIPKGSQSIKLNKLVTIKGPKGIMDLPIADFIGLEKDESKINVSIKNDKNRIQKQLWGTTRSLINNSVVGVTDGHSSTLRFQGTGYRAMLDEVDGVKWVRMKIGKCNLQCLPIPEGITVSAPTPTLLIFEGCNKQQINLFAARLRNMHPPEPYKGKGIYFNGETIKLKSKKVK
ncbi:hypothetical protein CANARDRAFT_214208 [[Candida] arabinofermentans NRRL YB-2248]|uniref:Large ribosomal subunit protein uL6 alpha-beta domain-containing protein n=1 Tax=[Candida] arabinofermentans NRRL YB-2248 TaxID=983967 RepID=A0A1E4SW81_9ASCO|nr:hypothetical protein CANARDRAFT_214208 [[Candida] arabinofermentans NRRL YB-2248]